MYKLSPVLWKYCTFLSCDIHLQENLKESQPTTHHIIPVKYNNDVLTHFTPLPTSPVWFIPLSLMSIHFYAKQLADRQLITVNIVSLVFFVKSSLFDLFECWWRSLWGAERVCINMLWWKFSPVRDVMHPRQKQHTQTQNPQLQHVRLLFWWFHYCLS